MRNIKYIYFFFPDLLTSNIQKRTFGFWIGFHELDEWAWTENIEVSYTNWGPGKPNGGGVSLCTCYRHF